MPISTAQSISSALLLNFNFSLTTGVFPESWENSVVVSIHKTSAPSSSHSDYHPITLLSLASKSLEHHVINVLSSLISGKNFPFNKQFSFQSDVCSKYALLPVTQLWYNNLDFYQSIYAVFLFSAPLLTQPPCSPTCTVLVLQLFDRFFQQCLQYLHNYTLTISQHQVFMNHKVSCV